MTLLYGLGDQQKFQLTQLIIIIYYDYFLLDSVSVLHSYRLY